MKVSVIFGTRPEAIKLCPVIRELRDRSCFDISVCATAQHREMLDQVLTVFDVKPDVDLNIMEPNQSLSSLTSRAVSRIDSYLQAFSPDLVVVQGDTTTTLCAALAAHYRHVPVAHVEAGLRTGNRYSPFPEEMNRVLTTRLTEYHFAPTRSARDNLIRENVPEGRIYISGNTVVDALIWAVKKIRQSPALFEEPELRVVEQHYERVVLITGHRRENFGEGFESICKAILALSVRFKQTLFVYPVHMNPNVRVPVRRMLSNRENIRLLEPLEYMPFVSLLNRCYLVLTDSGGIQEEAPTLGKPVLVMRDTTERPEGLEAGTAKLVGTNTESIFENASLLLNDSETYSAMSKATNPYGDGQSSKRIVDTFAPC